MKISNLLDTTPKWQHKDAKVRLRSLQNASLPDEAVLFLAQNDPEAEVRLTAITLIKNPSSLLPLCSGEAGEIRAAAECQWVSIVGSDLANFDLVTDELPESLLTEAANNAEQLDIKYKAASLIIDPHRLEKILFTPNHSKVHQLCATKIDDKSQLERIQKHYLDRDKNVTRIIKGKLQHIKSTFEREQAFQARIDKTLNTIEMLAISEYADDYDRRRSLLKDDWNKLVKEQPQVFTTDILQRFGQADVSCQRTVDGVAERQAKLIADVNEIIESLQSLTDSLTSSTAQISNIATIVAESRKRWPKGHDLAPFYGLTGPLEQLDGHYQLWLKIESRAEKLHPEELLKQLSRIHWPTAFTMPVKLSEARTQAEIQLANKQESKSKHQAKLIDLERELGQLTEAIEQGHLKQAGKLLSTLNHQLAGFSASQKILSGIQSSATKLAELRDWQGFVTNPKREELCNSMEKLAQDSAIPPQEKADAIKELQDSWKKLGPSDSREAQRFWSRFRKQADLAYKPCTIYFKQLKQIRGQNLVEKERICAALEVFLKENDWDDTDWKAVSDIMNKSKQEWRKHDDIVHAKRKKVHDRFNHSLDALYAKLRQEHERNHELKSALIHEIEALLQTDMTVSEMIEQTKTMQSRWKTVGIADRRVDQKLWKKFRAECDKVFNKREEQNIAYKQRANAVTMEAKQVCNSLSELLTSDNVVSQSDIRQFKKRFDAITLSKQNDHLRREFQHLLKSARQTLDQQKRASQAQMMMELKRLSDLCSCCETGQIDEAALAEAWQGDIELDKDLRKKIDLRRHRTIDSNQDSPERLCIKLEILAGIDSPPESKTERLAYQVERLNRELAQGIKETRSTKEQCRDIQVDWYCQSAGEDSDRLTSRFQRAEAKLGG